MAAPANSGWGGQNWGGSAWGGSAALGLQLIAALAVAENAVQLTFSEPVYFSELLDANDASQPDLFTFAPVAGSVGLDGTAARAVGSASVAAAPVQPIASPAPSVLIVTLDRPLTPSPSQYVIQVSPLVIADSGGAPIDPGFAQQQFTGVFKQVVVPQLTSPSSLATRDFASPDSFSSAQASQVPNPSGLLTLGVPVIVNGDYATDSGLVNLKKRILRRLLFIPGATVHLTNYGAGVTTYGKKLASAANRLALASACESQIGQEPDVAAVSVTALMSSQYPGLFYLRILVKSRTTGQGMKLLVPVSATPQPGQPLLAA